MTKKLRMSLLGMASVAAMAAPVALAVSCGGGDEAYVFKPQAPDASYSKPGTASLIAPTEITLVTDGGVTNDKSFNQQGWEALQSINPGVAPAKAVVPGSHTTDAITASYKTVTADNSQKLILAPGFYHVDAITKFQRDNASDDMKFILVDGEINSPNVASILYKTQEPAFLAGYMAGEFLKKNDTTPESHKVGTFGGGNFPGVTDFMKGFVDGVHYYNDHGNAGQPVAEADKVTFAKFGTDDAYTNTGFAVGGGSAAARKLLDGGADIILPVAGPQTQDTIDAIKASGKTNKAWIIGVDTDQSDAYPSDSAMFFTSIEKKIEEGFTKVYDKAAKQATLSTDPSLNGINGFGATTFGTLSNGLVGISQPDVVAAQSIYTDIMADTTLIAAAKNNANHSADWANALGYIKSL